MVNASLRRVEPIIDLKKIDGKLVAVLPDSFCQRFQLSENSKLTYKTSFTRFYFEKVL